MIQTTGDRRQKTENRGRGLSSGRGFTLPEMIAVIAITGVIAAGVAVFIRAPIQGYADSVRRAEMSDIADTALRRIGRDVRLALPNSVRVDGTGYLIEFLQTRSGGRYRAEGPGNALDFNAGDSSFEVLGPRPVSAANDEMVVYNLGIPGADAYAGNTLSTHNRRPLTGIDEITNIASLTSAARLPFASPAQRFHVVSGPVSYVCAPDPGGSAGTLTRYWNYQAQATQPLNPAVLPNVKSALLATHVSDCRFAYDAFVVAQRAGLVTMRLGLAEQGETINLYHAAHVDNVP